MRKAKATTGTVKKAAGPPARKRLAAATVARTRHAPVARRRKAVTAPVAALDPETTLARAQSDVVAAKFHGDEPAPRAQPTLPVSYGESHLLLLPRDPQTLFATWDLSPSLVDSLKSRLGARGFAVSTLTLRISSEGAETLVFHVGRRVRSRYLKVAGGSSFTAEIGFTTPTGRFESAARSVPCFLPQGPARSAFIGTAPPTEASYSAVPTRAKSEPLPAANAAASAPALAPAPTAKATPARSATAASAAGSVVPFRPSAPASTPAPPAAPRALGGASDLYRR